jgi:multiple sugar transport system substrate-binding protein
MKKLAAFLLIAGLLAAFSVPLFAGGQKEQAQLTQTVKYSLWDYGTDIFNREVVEAFEAQNPGMKVEVIDIPHVDYVDKLTVMLAGGEAVDVIMCYSMAQYNTIIGKNHALRLDDVMKEGSFDETNYGMRLANLKIDGKTYALSYRNDGWVLYFNKDIFDNNGVSYPTNDWTWDDFKKTAKTLTNDKAGTEKVWGAYIHWWPITHALPSLQIAYQKSGWDPLHGDSREYKPGFALLRDMEQVDRSAHDFATVKAQSFNWNTVFYSGAAAMMYTGTWAINQYVADRERGQHNVKWGAAQLPTWGGGMRDGAVDAPTPMVINAKTKNPDAAWKFLQFACGKGGAKILAKRTMLTGYQDAETMAVFKSSSSEIDDAVVSALKTDRVYMEYPADPKAGAFGDAYMEAISLIMTGSVGIDEGLAQLDKKRLEILAK